MVSVRDFSVLDWLVRRVSSHRFALAAFLVPLGIREIPEVLVGPYPVGFDTIAFYVPGTMDLAGGKVGTLPLLSTAPLFYILSSLAYLLSGANPVWIFKLAGPTIYGFMIWTLYRFARLGLNWSDKQSLGGALFASLYFVTLRTGWDQFRIVLGLAFILLSLPLLIDHQSRKSQVILSILLVLAVASNQLTGGVDALIVGLRIRINFLHNSRDDVKSLVKIAVPSFVLLIATAYADFIISGTGLFQNQPFLPDAETVSGSVGFLAFAYLPLIPLLALGFSRILNKDLRVWLIVCLAASLTALLPFYGLSIFSYRWSLLLDIPICVYATAGIVRIASLARLQRASFPFSRNIVVPAFSTVVMVFSMLYIALPADRAFPYYAMYPAFSPTSLIQDSVPEADMQSLKQSLDWTASIMGPNSVLITHIAIYGWARAYMPPNHSIISYGYSSPTFGLQMAKHEGYSYVLLIWWANGLGWHNQPTVPDSFQPIHQIGDMMVYEGHY